MIAVAIEKKKEKKKKTQEDNGKSPDPQGLSGQIMMKKMGGNVKGMNESCSAVARGSEPSDGSP